MSNLAVRSTPSFPSEGFRVLYTPFEDEKAPERLFNESPDVLTCKEAAKALRTNEKTLREYAREGIVLGFKVGKVWRFTKRSLVEFVEKGGYSNE